MDAGGDLGSAAKGLAIDLEVAVSGLDSFHVFFLTMCIRSSLACLSSQSITLYLLCVFILNWCSAGCTKRA